jgi:O-antigen ligase
MTIRIFRTDVGTMQLWTTVTVLVISPLFFGSVDQFWIAAWTILLSIGALCGTAASTDRGQRRVLLGFFLLCGIYLVVAVVQIVPNLIGQLNDPSWSRANDIFELNAPPRISSRAEISPIAAGHFLLFATSFINGFYLGTSQRNSETAIRWAQYSILAYVIYGLTAFIFTPNMILWTPKLAYRGSLTATFINRNTAATFVGAGAILWFCSAFSALQSLRFTSLRLLLLTPSNEHLAFKVVTRSAAALACFFALLLTGSRGGLLCSCVGLVVAIVLMVGHNRRLRFWQILFVGIGAVAVIFVLLTQTGRIGSHGLFDDGRWSVYGFCLDAIRQRPLLGAGLGTFADLFPSLRPSDFYSWGVWDYAHSTILEIAVEMGIPVTAMILLAASGSLVVLARAALKFSGRSRRSLAAITGIAVLSYLHSAIDFSLQIPGYLILFGILLGCGLGRASSSVIRVGPEGGRPGQAVRLPISQMKSSVSL